MIRDDTAVKELRDHILNHISYPATKKEIVEECDKMSHVPESTRKMVNDQLPNRTYKSADEVMMALGMK